MSNVGPRTMAARRHPWSSSTGGLDKLRPWFTLNASEIRWLCVILALMLLGIAVRALRQRRQTPHAIPPPVVAPLHLDR